MCCFHIQLYSSGMIRRPADIYRLGEKREYLEKIPGWGKQSTDNVLKAVEGSAAHCRLYPCVRLIMSCVLCIYTEG